MNKLYTLLKNKDNFQEMALKIIKYKTAKEKEKKKYMVINF